MTRDEVQSAVFQALTSVAPEIDPLSLNRDANLRDQVDLDSMDFLRFVIELHARLDVDVPEADYPRLATLSGAIDYLVSRLAAAAR